MHNWWIATLEHLGLLTREEAEHISNNIKLGIHRDVYNQAYNDLGSILSDSPSRSQIIKHLVSDVDSVKVELGKLRDEVIPPVTQAQETSVDANPPEEEATLPAEPEAPAPEAPAEAPEPVAAVAIDSVVSEAPESTPEAPVTEENKSVANATEA